MGTRMRVAFLASWLLMAVFSSVAFSADYREDANWKEIGAIWQNDYEHSTPYACHFDSLGYTDDFCRGLRDVLINKGKWAVNNAIWRGDTGQAVDIDESGYDKADIVDLFIWSGHGQSRPQYWPNGGVLHFVTNHSQNTANDYCNADCDAGNIEHEECRWGEGDCEFVVLFTCNFLNDFNDSNLIKRIKDMCQGVHVICGFGSLMETKFAQGATLGELLMGKAGWQSSGKKSPWKVVDAWYESCRKHQDSGKVARAVYYYSCADDYMPGNVGWASGLGMTNDPPPCNGSNYGSYILDMYVVP